MTTYLHCVLLISVATVLVRLVQLTKRWQRRRRMLLAWRVMGRRIDKLPPRLPGDPSRQMWINTDARLPLSGRGRVML